MVGSIADAAKTVLVPAVQQMSQQAAEQATAYAKEQGPKLIKEQLLPEVLKKAGVSSTDELGKAAIGKAGSLMSDSGGITGIAGKMLSKVGRKGKKGGGVATGYGEKRRMPIQQDIMVSLPVHEVYKGWTEYKRWPEFMHRVHGSDPDITDDGAKVRITEKIWLWTRPFTAEVTMQRPDEVIRWKSIDGPGHVGLIAFHELGEYLTLVSVNLDHAPKGPIEKISRGARFNKRAIRGDLHRFKGWLEHRSSQELEDIEGWMGTIEDGEIVQTHDDWMEENGGQEGEGSESAGNEEQDGEGAEQGSEDGGQGGEEDGESGQEGGQEDEEDDQALEEDNTAVEEDEPEDEEGLGSGQPEAEEGEEEEDEEEEEEPEEEEEEEEEPQPAQMSADDEEEEEEEEEEEPEERPLPAPRKRVGTGGQRRKAARKTTKTRS